MTTWILRLLMIVIPLAGGVYWFQLRRRHAGDKAALRQSEIQLAIVAGAIFLSFLAFLAFVAPQSGGKPGDFYIAPYEVDGKIMPSEFITQEEARARGLIKEDPPKQETPLETFGD